MSTTSWAEEEFRVFTYKDIENNKAFYDDPRPWYLSDDFNLKKTLPPDVYANLSYDIETMKNLWAEIVGFRSPDVVNKTAPEIKPGTYSHKDKEQHPGLKTLMTAHHYDRFKPGAPPLAGNFPEITIVPTQQYYYALPIAEATKKHMGKTMLDDKTGIIKEDTYIAGYPYPKPEGNFKANQIYYNWLKRYWGWDSKYILSYSRGWTSSLREDVYNVIGDWVLKLQGRVMAPLGWFDKDAQERGEFEAQAYRFIAPRDVFGNIISRLSYVDSEKYDQLMIYVNTLRRVRLMSSTDVQDSIGGGDIIYLDGMLLEQKLSTSVFPSKLEIIAEKELLLPNNHDGSAYLTSPKKGLEYHNLKWERRPVYVIKMTILDKNFVYGHRMLFIDKETFQLRLIENYDQKGRLYRTNEVLSPFIPDMGVFNFGDSWARDYLDSHSSLGRNIAMPVPWIGREKVGLEYLFTKGK